jgi:hypothetical protein
MIEYNDILRDIEGEFGQILWGKDEGGLEVSDARCRGSLEAHSFR